VRLKAYCYALRAALSLAWIRERQSPPPMALPNLLAGTSVAAEVHQAIDALVQSKLAATEKDTMPRNSVLDRLIAGVLAEPATRPQPGERPDVQGRVDRLFLQIIETTA
jgi:hypothetical protein